MPRQHQASLRPPPGPLPVLSPVHPPLQHPTHILPHVPPNQNRAVRVGKILGFQRRIPLLLPEEQPVGGVSKKRRYVKTRRGPIQRRRWKASRMPHLPHLSSRRSYHTEPLRTLQRRVHLRPLNLPPHRTIHLSVLLLRRTHRTMLLHLHRLLLLPPPRILLRDRRLRLPLNPRLPPRLRAIQQVQPTPPLQVVVCGGGCVREEFGHGGDWVGLSSVFH